MFTCHDSGNSGPRGAAWNTGATKIFRQRCVWRFDRSLKENDVIRSTLSLRRVDPKNQAMKKGLTRVVTPSTFTVKKWVISIWFSCHVASGRASHSGSPFLARNSLPNSRRHPMIALTSSISKFFTWRFPSHSYSWRMCWSIFICLDNLCDLHCRAAATGEIRSGDRFTQLTLCRCCEAGWCVDFVASNDQGFAILRAYRGYRRRRCAVGEGCV